jgi:hypothetical protein
MYAQSWKAPIWLPDLTPVEYRFLFSRLGAGAGIGAGAGTEDVDVDCAPLNTAPFSRLTSFNAAVFPAKNSLAEIEGSDEAAAG